MIVEMGKMIAALAAGAAVLCLRWPRHRRLPDDGRHGGQSWPSLTFVMEMLAVAIGHGASVPYALDRIGRVAAGEYGEALQGVAAALHRGTDWESAWAIACGIEDWAADCRVLRDAMEPSWRHGASPLSRLEATVETMGSAQHQHVEEAGGRLSVTLLMPIGLCFLPAFVLVGVIPAIASFAGGIG